MSFSLRREEWTISRKFGQNSYSLLRLRSLLRLLQRDTSKRRAGGASSSASAKMANEGEAVAAVQAVYEALKNRGDVCASADELALLLRAVRSFPRCVGVITPACWALYKNARDRAAADSAVEAGAAEALAACLPHESVNAHGWLAGAQLVYNCSHEQLQRFSNAGWPDAALSLLRQLLLSPIGAESYVLSRSHATFVLSKCLKFCEPAGRQGLLEKGAVEARALPLPLLDQQHVSASYLHATLKSVPRLRRLSCTL